MKECDSGSWCKNQSRFPRLSGWKVFPHPVFGGVEDNWLCPEHIGEGRENSKVVCVTCKKVAYLADGRGGWGFVHTPAGTLWYCSDHIAEERNYARELANRKD